MDTENLEIQETEALEPLSKADAMVGVFTSPGATFETIRNTPKTNYWAMPLIIMIIASVIASFLFLQDNDLLTKVLDKQKREMMKRFEENVKNGKMTQEQVKTAMEQTEKYMGKSMIAITSYSFAVLGAAFMFFLVCVIYLLALKIMKAEFDFGNILNVVGLALLINAIGGLVTIGVSIIVGELSTVSLGLILKEKVIGESLNGFLSRLDLFSIWYYTVIAIGLAKIARIKPVTSYSTVFGLWVIWLVITNFGMKLIF